MGLLATYAAGLGVPFLLVALFTRELAARMRLLRRVGWILQIAAGVVLVAMGIAMMTGRLSTFAFWLLETFPALGRIG
jgi:cytochrome c-type biogenesis protein